MQQVISKMVKKYEAHPTEQPPS